MPGSCPGHPLHLGCESTYAPAAEAPTARPAMVHSGIRSRSNSAGKSAVAR